MKRRFVILLAITLAAIGLAIFGYRAFVLGLPLAPDQSARAWDVEATIRFQSGPGSIKVNLQLPTLMPGYMLADEFPVSPGYGFAINYVTGGREAQWAVRRADGPQTIYYRAVLYEDTSRNRTDTTPPFPPPPQLEEPFRTATNVLIREVEDRSADPASFTSELLRRMNDPAPDQHVSLLLSRAENRADFINVVTQVLAAARYPARLVRGIYLNDRQRDAEIVPWLEMHDGIRWIYFNPVSGGPGPAE